MDVKDWEIIVTLYETKNVTKAARKLFMTQPALSLRLKNIEQYFGTKLVLRGNKGVQFTEEGEFLMETAKEQVRTIARVRDTLTNMRSTMSGIIRIGSTNYNTRYFLPYVLKKFREAHPFVEFRVSSGVGKDVVSMVRNNEVHIGFIRGAMPWDGEKHLLFKEKIIAVNKDPFRVEDLPGMQQIQCQIAPSNQELLDKWWDERFASPPLVAMVVDLADTCYDLVSQGLGYGFLPKSVFIKHAPLFHHEMRFLSGSLVERNIWAILHEETRQLRLVNAFLQMVQGLDFPTLLGDEKVDA